MRTDQAYRSQADAAPSTRPDTPTLWAARRDAANRRLLALADAVGVLFALWFGAVVLGADALEPAVLAFVPAVILVAKTLGLYDRDQLLLHTRTLDESPGVFQVATLLTLLLLLAEPAVIDGQLGRDQVLGLWGILFASMLAARPVARRMARAVSRPERCLVLGSATAARSLARKVATSHGVSAEVVGRIPLGPERPKGPRGPAVLGTVGELADVIAEHDVERVIVAPRSLDRADDELLDLIRLVRSLGVKVSLQPRLLQVVGSAVEFDEIEGSLLLGLRREGLSRSSLILKRGLDLSGAFAGLLLLAPLLAVIAVAIKLGSPGPVLFRQRRIGLEGAEFEMLKFRTMVDGADSRKDEVRGLNEAEAGLFKVADDPRLTRVGRVLRRLSLDELPQLVNVVRREMSLVGPRPLVPDEDRLLEGHDRRRLHVLPGMTGPWQLFGPARVSLAEMAKIDYAYAANWSIWLDIRILLRTIPHALFQRGL